jgi:hypothetical protein
VVEECVEHYANGLAARNDAKNIEGHGEVEGCGAWDADSEGAEDGEGEGCYDLEWNFKKRIREEEGREWVCTILVFVVKNL